MPRPISAFLAAAAIFSPIIFARALLDQEQRHSCHARCDHIPTWIEFEECLRLCFSRKRSILPESTTAVAARKYPERPNNVVVLWNVQIERYVKYLRATVYWEALDDPLRDGFYLSFLPTNKRCEELFPGYYTHNIPKDSNSWEIPANLPGLQPLIIDYGCEYRVELRSKPYPYGDAKYTLVETFEVPACVDGYCSCKQQRKVPPPSNLQLLDSSTTSADRRQTNTNFDTAFVSWRYNLTEDFFDERTKTVQFRILLADLFRKPTVAPWKKLFKWRRWNSTVLASPEQYEYSTELPDVKEGFEYKIQIFAMNEHMCKSAPVEKEFIFSSSPRPSSTTRGPVSTESVVVNVPATVSTDKKVKNDTSSSLDETTLFNSTELDTIAGDHDQSIGIGRIEPTSPPAASSSPSSTAESAITATATSISMETVKTPYSREEYFLMVFLPIITVLCLIITAFATCKFYAARKQKLLKNQQYFERLMHFPWTVLNHESTSPSMETNILYTEKEIIDARARGLADEYEISYERLTLGRVIGQGAFGLVYLGTALAINNAPGLTQVAIKQLKANADERERCEFLEEIAIMKKVGHHANIVAMYGCCTLQYPHCMVMEYVPYGDLLRYLRHLRKEFEKQIEEYRISLERDYIMHLNTHPLMTHAEINAATLARSMASRIHASRSDGLDETGGDGSVAYAEDSPIPFADADHDILDNSAQIAPPIQHHMQQHQDAQNILTYSLDPAELQSFAYQVACGMNHLEQLNITHRDLAARNILVGHGKTLKISDFGLSRMGVYVKTTSGRIPLRWLSIEAMRDHVYSTKSDVWAYGTVLWEISTLGGFPYPTVADKDLLRYLECGNRLEKPVSCTDPFYRLMLQCWADSPAHRPAFARIKQTLDEMNKQASPYVEFSPDVVASSDDRGVSSVLPPQEYCRISPLAGVIRPAAPASSSSTSPPPPLSSLDNL